MAGQSAAKNAVRESTQEARIDQLEQQQQGYGAPQQPGVPAQSYQQYGVPTQSFQQPGAPVQSPAESMPMDGQTSETSETSAPQQKSTSTTDARIEQLSKLGELRKSGVLTDTEFEAEKQKILQEK